jgi:hypothetical protein
MARGLRSLLRRNGGDEPAPAPQPVTVAPAERVAFEVGSVRIEADALGADGRVTFMIESREARLVDALNAAAAEPMLVGNGGTLDLDDLLIVVAPERVSDPAKRLHRPGHLVQLRIGPWQVEGNAHGPPAADVIGYWMRYRPHFVVITDAKLSHSAESGYASHPALLVNLWMADSATLPKPNAEQPAPAR